MGGVRVRGTGKVEFEEVVFEQNKGKLVGGIMVEEKTLVYGQKMEFYDNLADDQASACYYTGKSNGFLDECLFYGKQRDDDFYASLLDKDATARDYDLPRAGAIEVDGQSLLSITSSEFLNNSASYGAILSSEMGVLSVRDCIFQRNAAYNGGGVFVEGGRGSYARVMDSQFVENVARYGGAMVVAGQLLSLLCGSCEWLNQGMARFQLTVATLHRIRH